MGRDGAAGPDFGKGFGPKGLLAALFILASAARGWAGPADDALVQTESGIVRGTVGADYRSFQGIPFAAPPVGDLRWHPPRPPAPWGAPLDASRPGSPCPQGKPGAGNALVGQEDCLTLDVTTPYGPMANRPLPVMIWIHGGDFTSGAGSAYDGKNLVVKGNVVLVTFNYRLGIFGFLAHLALDQESPSSLSGNFGFADQQAVLRWTQRNIAGFGGDPQNVTLFGEEAGAVSICAHLAAPESAGLFRRAILQSGACTSPLPRLEDEEKHGASVAEGIGCDSPDIAPSCLRAKSTADLLKVADAQWGPVAGGPGLLLQPADAFANGSFGKIALMAGTIRGSGAAADGPCLSLAMDAFAARKIDLYAYEFATSEATETRPAPAKSKGASGAELPYLFAISLDGVPANLAPAKQALADQMVGYWTEFARKGDPNGPGLPPWPKFRSAADVLALAPMPEGSHTVNFDREHHCGSWRTQSAKGGNSP